METTYPSLSKPPVVGAIFQIRYAPNAFDIKSIETYSPQLERRFPIKKKVVQVGVNIDSTKIPLGDSQLPATSTIGGYDFLSKDQRQKIAISKELFSYFDERPYAGWDTFKNEAFDSLSLLADILNKTEINRTSIRFINRFVFPEFDNPGEYFNALISATEHHDLIYPLRQYGFRLRMDVPETDAYAIVNHNVEMVQEGKFLYTFDIDVLDCQRLAFDLGSLDEKIHQLRGIKNKIFFESVTQKTLELCN